MTIEPIETEYKGYKFRSRLEARWALFFDTLRVKYNYELDSFGSEDFKYLPDFFLTQKIQFFQEDTLYDQIWVEVKPNTEISFYDQNKIKLFVKQSQKNLILLVGDPGLDTIIRFYTRDPDGKVIYIDAKWIILPGNKLGLINLESYQEVKYPKTKEAIDQRIKSKILLNAYKKAKQKRFEEESRKVNPNNTIKICADCGKEFIPKADHHKYCMDCYRQRMNTPIKETKEETIPVPASHEKLALPKQYIYGFASLIILLVLVVIIITFSTLGRRSSLGDDPMPTPVCACDRNTYDCKDFEGKEDAQDCFDFCYPNYGDVHYLDTDGDQTACELLP
jgi:hypothetical protein